MSQRETVLEVLPRPRRAPLWATGFLRFSKRLVQEKPLGAFGGLVILTMLIVGLFAQLIAPFAYDEPDFFNILAPPGAPHVLGTDHLGRDMLSRIIVGAQVSMIVVAGAVSLRARCCERKARKSLQTIGDRATSSMRTRWRWPRISTSSS